MANAIGRHARASQPYIEQIFVGRPPDLTEDDFERKLYVVRKRIEAEICSLHHPGQGHVLRALPVGADHYL